MPAARDMAPRAARVGEDTACWTEPGLQAPWNRLLRTAAIDPFQTFLHRPYRPEDCRGLVAGTGKHVLVLVPSLALMSRTMREWTIDAGMPLRSYAVCSDSRAGKRRRDQYDVAEVDLHDLDYPATTNSAKLASRAANPASVADGRSKFSEWTPTRCYGTQSPSELANAGIRASARATSTNIPNRFHKGNLIMTRLIRNLALAAVSSIAIGIAANSASAQEVAVQCRGDVTADSIECGDGANTTGDDTTAFGDGSLASNVNATAVGSGAQATGRSSTAIGSAGVASRDVIAGAGYSTAVGSGTQIAEGATGATAVGDFNTIGTTGSFSVAFGAFNTVNATSGVAIGNAATVTLASTDAIAIGTAALGSAEGTVAIGRLATASSASAVAIGDLSLASATNSVAIGNNASTSSLNAASLGSSVAIGTDSVASDEDAVALGDQATASGFHSTAVGGESAATGVGSQTFGWQSLASGDRSTAIGRQAQATQANAVALGDNSRATAVGATALGQGATAAFSGSTAVGTGATTTAANQVTLGASGSSVRVGDIAASTAAQTGALNFVTVDANGTLGRTVGPDLSGILAQQAALASTQAAQGAAIGTLFDLAEINEQEIQRANEGVAMALAMESPSLPEGATFAIGGGVGYYNHRTAGTAAFAVRVGRMSSFSGGVGVGLNSGEVGAKAGFQHAW